MTRILFSGLGSIILFLILVPQYLRLKKGNHRNIALTIKGLGTMIPIFFCLIATIQLSKDTHLEFISPSLLLEFSRWLLAGLLLCLFGDIVLGIHFEGGMGAFLIGHFCYISAFRKLAVFHPLSIGLFIILFLVFIFFYSSLLKTNKNSNVHNTNLSIFIIVLFLIYGTVILVMVSIAFMLPFTIGTFGILPAIGASLFVISDLILARNILIRVTPLSDAVSLYSYYAGQFALAMSVYLYY